MIKNISSIALLLFFILQSCKNEKTKNIHKELSKKWLGVWVVDQPFVAISKLDTSFVPITNSDQIINSNLTEVHLEKMYSDSIEFLYADSNKQITKMKKFSNDTLYTTDGTILAFDNLNNKINVILKSNSNLNSFSRAPHNLIKKNSTTTTFRNMFNTELHKFSYVLIDSLNNWDNRQYVTFFANEKVRGFYDFKNYKVNLFGEESNVSDAISISFTSENLKENFGAIFYADSIELYSLIKDHLKGNNTFKKEKKAGTLLKQKWEQ